MNSLSNEEIEQLIKELKILKDNYIKFPIQNYSENVEIISIDKKHKFELILNRKVIKPINQDLKVTYTLLYARESLIRIDINGPEHRNPEFVLEKFDNTTLNVPCPHIHMIYDGFNIAFPLDIYIDYKEIEKVSDLIEILIKFLEMINIKDIKKTYINLGIL